MDLKKVKVKLPNWKYVLSKVKSIKLSDLAKNSSFCAVNFKKISYFDANHYDDIDDYNNKIKIFLFYLEALIRNDETHLPGIVFEYNNQFGLPISSIRTYLSSQKGIFDSVDESITVRIMLRSAYLSFIKLYYPAPLYDSLAYYCLY